MEITKVEKDGVKIKSKLATFAVNPFNAKGKIPIDCVLLFSKSKEVLPSFETSPLIVEGPGEYEIKGVKLSGVGKKESLLYVGKLDGIDIVIMQASAALKGKD